MAARSLATKLAAVVLLTAVAGCARPPTLGSVLKDKYPGYQQLLPATSVSLRDVNYEYVPGTMLTATQRSSASRSEAPVWVADPIYCPPGYSLADVPTKQRNPVKVVYDFDLSLRRLLHLQKAKADLNLEENEIEFIRHVEIRVESPRTYSIRRGKPVPQYVKACVDAIMQRPGVHKLRSILVGNIYVDVFFKDNVSLMAKIAIANKINASFGFGLIQGESYTISGDNMVFGAKVARIRN